MLLRIVTGSLAISRRLASPRSAVGLFYTPESRNPHLPPWERLVALLTTPGTGQVRKNLDPNARRRWDDLQLLSHFAFVPGICVAAGKSVPLLELVALQSAVLGLSLLYHWKWVHTRRCLLWILYSSGLQLLSNVCRSYKRPGLLAKAEGISAKMLFIYESLQTLQCSDPSIIAATSGCFALTLCAFVATNFNKQLYDRWHPWSLHVVPGIWSTLIAVHNEPLLLSEWLVTVRILEF